MKSFIRTDKTKVETEGSTDQQSTSGMRELCVPHPPQKVKKKAESLPAAGSSQSLMKFSVTYEVLCHQWKFNESSTFMITKKCY